MRVALLLVCAFVVGGCFDASLPKGALVLCRTNAECPEGACDLGTHTCATAGARSKGPTAAKATFTPAFANDGAHVVLDVATDVPVAATPAPTLTFAGADDPGFAFAAPDGGAHAVFTLDVTADVAERFYTLTAIELADADGHVATSPLDAVLDVDRTPPVIGAPLVDDGAGGTQFADVAPDDTVRVRFTSSEPLDLGTSSATVGALALACAAASDNAYACTGSLDQAGDGDNPIAVSARDRAGNLATVTTSIAVDASAPFVVPGSARVTVDGRDDFVAVTVGDTVELELLVSEALASPPALTLGGAGTSALPFAIDVGASQGNFYVARVVVGAVPQDGVVPIVATMTDVFGHESADVVVPLPAPHEAGLDVVAVPPSPCVVPPENGDPATQTTCTDFDGDGFFGPSAGCAPDPVDCDDADPTVYPGAIEIPGNGHDDGCTGAGDAPADEAHVVFVDPSSTIAGATDGTRAHPFVSLDAGTAAAASSVPPKVVFLAVGTEDNPAGIDLPVPVVGGLDPTTWQRDANGTRTTLDSGTNGVGVEGGYLSGVFVPQQIVNSRPTLFVDVVGRRGLSVGHPVIVVGCDFTGSPQGDLFLFGNADGSRILRSSIGEMFPSSANVLLDRVFGGRLSVEPGGDVAVTNSVLFGDNSVVASCDACSSLVIVHSNLRGESAGGSVVDVEAGAGSTVVVASDNIAAIDGVPVFFKQPGSALFVLDNVIQDANGPMVQVAGAGDVAVDLPSLEACAWDGCASATGNHVAPLALAQDETHLASDDAANPSFHSATNIPRAVRFPTTVAGDVDLQCRYVGGAVPDVGPDQH